MATDDLLLEVRDLCTSFQTEGGPVRAVDGVSFDLCRGRTLALVGESGCGKSVTAYSIMRLIQEPGRIVSGRISLRPPVGPALDVVRLPDGSVDLYRLRGGLAAMIFQEPQSALSPVHTIGQQLREAILLHQDIKPREADRVALNMLARVGIQQAEVRMGQYAHELSGGMRQRAVIAMALVCNPLLLIADEPTTALDTKLQAQMFELFKEMQRQRGTALLLITHDFSAVAQMADEVAVMYCGRIVERAPVRTLIGSPRHPYTRGLLSSMPGVGPRQKGKRLLFIPGTVPPLFSVPSGCPFHPRCTSAQPGVCDQDLRPNLKRVAVDHEVACFRAQELVDE